MSSSGEGGLGAATYYGAIGLAIVVILILIVSSRILFTRRRRVAHARERVEMDRRGEEGGLPSYLQTTAPQTLSYFHSPPGFLRPGSSRIAVLPTAHLGDSVVGPPAYVPPPDLPKYEEELREDVASGAAAPSAGEMPEVEPESPPVEEGARPPTTTTTETVAEHRGQ